jgi:alpha-glucosidase
MSKWFENALFYEIYPTSFKDSNDDGIGDLKGIASKLEYIKDLGFNAIWLNPFYVSPFMDGGYDVKDYFNVDPKFGTMKDWSSLIKKAHKLGIHIIIDLVPGHTSEQHPLFLKSAEAKRNKYSDMFIWNGNIWSYERPYILISGRHNRNGSYMVNFFSCQPALNYGFKEVKYDWQLSYKDPKTFIARDFIKKVMLFWLNKGADGFRVDMADSLVKDDEDKECTIEVWNSIIPEVKKAYPNCFLVSEWSNPDRSLRAGFDSDFILEHWDNFYHFLVRAKNSNDVPVLKGGSQDFFRESLLRHIDEARNRNGHISIISGNHDTGRIASYLNEEELRNFYLMQFTLPGIPFVYYGDEIGMKHRDLDSKDGGYQRTGDRTPMEWDSTKNRGFSNTERELYLPVGKEKTNVLAQMSNKNSLLNYIKSLIEFRKEHPNLVNNDFVLEDYTDGRIVYVRDDIKVIVNLSKNPIELNESKVLFKSSSKALKNNALEVGYSVIISK